MRSFGRLKWPQDDERGEVASLRMTGKRVVILRAKPEGSHPEKGVLWS